jgi:hypothetical protein
MDVKLSLILREEPRLRVLRIFRPKWVEVAGGWRRVHNEEHHNLYTSPNVVMVIKLRKMRLVENAAYMREMRNAYKICQKA